MNDNILGILFAPLEPYGRPRIWESPEKMQQDIIRYFSDCATNSVEVLSPITGEIEMINKPLIPTIEGLCMMLDIDRKTLLNYGKEVGYEEFFHTVKRAKEYILYRKTNALLNGGGQLAGLIFDLKNNHGWADKVETDITSGGDPLAPVEHTTEIILS